MTPDRFWRAVADRLAAGVPVFVALVAAHTRGSPGTTGARLWLDAEGNGEGTIGGGVMEANLLSAAAERLASDAHGFECERLVHRNRGAGRRSGLICAGEQTHCLGVLDPRDDHAAIERFARACEQAEEPALQLLIEPAGVQLSAVDIDAAAPRITLAGKDGDWRYGEDSVERRRLAIVGGGHCGQALARLADGVGYDVTLFDTREVWLAQADVSTRVRRVTIADYADAAALIGWPALTRVVVMSAAMPGDVRALSTLIDIDWRYLAVMGSAAKQRAIRQALQEQGAGAERLARIHGPVGLAIKSDTPPEIAISVMAELLQQDAETAEHMDRK